MSNYNSTNTIILATHEAAGGNTRMLLLHICDSGRHEYVIGSYFTRYKEYIDRIIDDAGEFHTIVADKDGNCFTLDKHEDVGIVNSLTHWPKIFDNNHGKYYYEWDWGHYFSDGYSEGGSGIVNAVDYWKREVLGIE